MKRTVLSEIIYLILRLRMRNQTLTAQVLFIIAPGDIALNPATLPIPQTAQAAVTVNNANGPVTPTTLAWSSSNPAIATVDAETGIVTPVAAGSATIIGTGTALLSDGTSGRFSGFGTVNVTSSSTGGGSEVLVATVDFTLIPTT